MITWAHCMTRSPIMRADRIPVAGCHRHAGHAPGAVWWRKREPLLARDIPGLPLTLHAAAEWENNPAALERCKADIATADIVIATMLFPGRP